MAEDDIIGLGTDKIDRMLSGNEESTMPDDDGVDMITAAELPDDLRAGISKFIRHKTSKKERKRRKEIRREKIRPEWQAQRDKVNEFTDQIKAGLKEIHKLAQKAGSLDRFFWAQVETDLDYYGPMKLSEETDEIILYEEEED